jgi:hypothetical protein
MTDEKTPTAFRTCTLSKGRGSSVTAYIVPSNHNDPIKGEVQLKIDNQVDLATLEEILLWFRTRTIKVYVGGHSYTSILASSATEADYTD